jgi:uncharacterized protein (TIGR03437 family)
MFARVELSRSQEGAMKRTALLTVAFVLAAYHASGEANGASPDIRELEIAIVDMCHDDLRGLIYASTTQYSSQHPSSVVAIDPLSATVVSSLNLAGRPQPISLSHDGAYLYAGLQERASVVRVDVDTWTKSLEIPLAIPDSPSASARDLESVPGRPESVAVVIENVRDQKHRIAIYDGARRRPEMASGNFQTVTFAGDPPVAYTSGYRNMLYQLDLTESGVGLQETRRNLVHGSSTTLVGSYDRIYTSVGNVVDVDALQLAGRLFDGTSEENPVFLDEERRRVWRVKRGSIQAYDVDTFLPVVDYELPSDMYSPGKALTGWDDDGLAFASYSRLYLTKASEIPQLPDRPLPLPMTSDGLKQLGLVTNDMVYDRYRNKIYASVPHGVPTYGNSIAVINAGTARIDAVHYVGSMPGVLALSDRARYLYVALNGRGSIVRIDPGNWTSDLEFFPGDQIDVDPPSAARAVHFATAMAALPDSFGAMAVALQNTAYPGSGPYDPVRLAIFDGDICRPRVPDAGTSELAIGFGDGAAELYVSSEYSISTFAVRNDGLEPLRRGPQAGSSEIVHDRGLLFTSGGLIVDPVRTSFRGRFDVTGVAWPDPDSDLVYYLQRFWNGGPAIRSFERTTFRQIGETALPPLSSHLVSRFRKTLLNEFIFRSPEEIHFVPATRIQPLPATPEPEPAVTGKVTELSLPINDLVFSTQTGKILASVPWRAGSFGNTITEIDPSTGEVGASIFVGSEPRKLAISSDGRYVYVELAWAGEIVRLDLSDNSVDLRLPLLRDVNPLTRIGDFRVWGMQVLPDDPAAVAIHVRVNAEPKLIMYRRETLVRFDHLERFDFFRIFSEDGVLVTVQHRAAEMAIYEYEWQDGPGTLRTITAYPCHLSKKASWDARRLITSSGCVVDTAGRRLVGRLGLRYGSLLAVEHTDERGSFIVVSSYGPLGVHQYDRVTLRPLARQTNVESATPDGSSGEPSSLIRCGSGCIALRVGFDKLQIIRTTALPPLLDASIPPPDSTGVGVRKLDLAFHDIVYNSARNMLYVSVPEPVDGYGGAVVPIDPDTGMAGAPIRLGNDPRKLRVSSDGRYLYASVADATRIQQFDLVANRLGRTFHIEADRESELPAVDEKEVLQVGDFDVPPASHDSVAVARVRRGRTLRAGIDGGSLHGVALHGERGDLPASWDFRFPDSYEVPFLGYTDDPGRLYGNQNGTLLEFRHTGDGLYLASKTPTLFRFTERFISGQGLLYSVSGRLVDPAARRLLGAYDGAPGVDVAVDSETQSVYFLGRPYPEQRLLWFYRQDSFSVSEVWPVSRVPGFEGTPYRMVSCGRDCLAIGAGAKGNSDNRVTELYVLHLTELALPRPRITKVANAASFETGLAPGAILSIFGYGLGPAQAAQAGLDASGRLAKSAAGVSVMVNGLRIPLLFVHSNQINAVMPYSIKGNRAQLIVEREGVPSDPMNLTLRTKAPGIFTLDGSGRGQAVAICEDGTINGPANPAPRGSVVTIFATGAGTLDPPMADGELASPPLPEPLGSVTVEVNGEEAEVLFAAAAPGTAGVLQVNFRIPESAGTGSVRIVLKIRGYPSSHSVTIAVQ